MQVILERMIILARTKLTASLIKEEYCNILDCSELIKDDKAYYTYELKEELEIQGVIIVGEETSNTPDWLELLQTGASELIPDMCNQSTRAVLFIKVDDQYISFIFGHGRHLLKDDVIVRDFGLKVVLNSIDPYNLKSIDLSTMDQTIFQTRSQASKSTKISDFNFDIASDLLRAITGIPQDNTFGKVITGKDSLHFSYDFENSFSSFKTICEKLVQLYYSEKYKQHFGWVDNLRVIQDKDKKEELDNLLIEQINQRNTESISLGIPEVIDYALNEVYSYTQKGDQYEDLDIRDYYNYIEKYDYINITQVKKQVIYSHGNGDSNSNSKWKVYECLIFEATLDEDTYVLTIGEWFKVDNNYAEEVGRYVENIEDFNINFPNCKIGEHENVYNERVANGYPNMILLDCENISYDGSDIELCDLLTTNKEFIHVKKWYQSSTTSHLLSQGRISGELLLREEEFRKSSIEKINEINSDFSTVIKLRDYVASEVTIVFAIIDKDPRELHERLPFFSKLNMMQAAKFLRGLGYKVNKLKIIQETE